MADIDVQDDEFHAPALVPSSAVALPPDRHPALVYVARLSPGSRAAMRHALATIAEILAGNRDAAYSMPWAAIEYRHVTAVRSVIASRYAPNTSNRILTAMKGVLKECWRLGQMSAEQYHRAIDVEPVRGHRLPAGRGLSAGELRALCAACDEDPSAAGRRNGACLAVLYGAGLRRREAVQLQVTDYDRVTGSVTVRQGKGNKSRVAYVTNGAVEAISAWLAARGAEPGPLLCPVNKAGHVVVRPMTDHALYFIMLKLAHSAGVKRFSPHDCRRSMVSDLLDAGVDISIVQQLAGHSSCVTTAKYDKRPERAKQKGAAALHMPFGSRS